MKSGKVIIIAEAGVNHNGSLQTAFELVDCAVEAGADYVKFQTFKANKLVSDKAQKAAYQIVNTQNDSETQFEMLRKLELSEENHEKLVEYSSSKGIKFFSTAFDLDSLNYLSKLGMDMVKIPSGEITNLPYLRRAASLFNKVIISTGMATIEEVGDAVNVFLQAKIAKENITILHCNTEYPTPMNDVNLRAMLHIGEIFETSIGYSDHTLGIEVPIAAVALGATMIEKHFTLDNKMPGPDHKASLEPLELQAMVTGIRNIELAVSGSGLKEPSPSEKKNIAIARKSIVAASAIKKGEILTEDNLTVKRPGTGLSPMLWDEAVGTQAVRDFDKEELISLS